MGSILVGSKTLQTYIIPGLTCTTFTNTQACNTTLLITAVKNFYTTHLYYNCRICKIASLQIVDC